jgi:hypothetical protein
VSLPLADLAVVDSRKLKDYLLSPDHPIGRHKARFFAFLGFWRVNSGALARALRTLARRERAERIARSAYGTKYEVRGMLRGPSGKEAMVVTIWIIRPADPRPHLVTAYPGDRE